MLSKETLNRIYSKPIRTYCFLIILGALVPLITGLVVKVYLMMNGVPTIPIAAFITGLTNVLPLIIFWTLPFILLSIYAKFSLYSKKPHASSFTQRSYVLTFGALSGYMTSIIVFWYGWQPYQDMLIVFSPFLIGIGIVLGLLVGFILYLNVPAK